MKKMLLLFAISIATNIFAQTIVCDEYITIIVNGDVTGPIPSSVTIAPEDGGTYSFTLLNFILPTDPDDPEAIIPVGNVQLTGLEMIPTEDKYLFSTTQTIIIQDGDDENYEYWMASMLPPVPVTASGYIKLDGEAFVNIDIDMVDVMGQIINVTFANYGKYSREVVPDNFGTICLPAAVAAEDHAGAIFYSIAGTYTDNDIVKGIVLEEVNSLEAGTPYIFRANDCWVELQMNGEVASLQPATGLIGNLSTTDAEVLPSMYNYILKDNELHNVAVSGVIVGPNKAYIDLSDVAAASPVGPRRIVLGIEGENISTAIEVLEEATAIDWNKPVYNVFGQRVAKGTMGVLLQDGIKFIVR